MPRPQRPPAPRPLRRVLAIPLRHRRPLRHDDTDHASLPPTISQTACCEATRETVDKPAAAPAPGELCAEDLALTALCGQSVARRSDQRQCPACKFVLGLPWLWPWLAFMSPRRWLRGRARSHASAAACPIPPPRAVVARGAAPGPCPPCPPRFSWRVLRQRRDEHVAEDLEAAVQVRVRAVFPGDGLRDELKVAVGQWAERRGERDLARVP
jgi:hypothetical protein